VLARRLDWFEDEEGKKAAKANKIVILKHMFTKEELDVRKNLGPVRNLRVLSVIAE
jgi:hypothetical protein